MQNVKFERLFNHNERAVIVAMDHCMFDGPIDGMTNLAETAAKVDAVVDGILLSPAMIPQCKHAFNYKGAPMAVARLNWSTVYCYRWGYKEAVTVPAFSPAEALRLGADIALISLTLETGSEANDAKNIKVFRELCAEAKSLGMPVIGEYYPAEPEKLSPAELHQKVFACTRIIAELGADLIKTFSTEDFQAVVKSCHVPVLGLGAARLPTQLAALKLAEEQVKAGASGVVFGRNAIQVGNPAAFQRALCDVVKHNVAPVTAAENHKLAD